MATINKNVRCASCIYAKQDINASDYTQKHCKTCEYRETCEICRDCEYYDTCKTRTNPKLTQRCDRRFEMLCSRQTLKRATMECRNSQSEYFKALLNVKPNGDRQDHITWNGCPCGERGERS